MNVQLPDPLSVAKEEATQLARDPGISPHVALDRIVADAPFAERERLTDGLVTFHRERMERIPSHQYYPEAVPWVDHVIHVDQHLQELTGFSDLEMAMHRSLGMFTRFRRFSQIRVPTIERCRTAYLPDSDYGQIHIKNIDDPITHYQPPPAPTSFSNQPGPLMLDCVGSGLHMDIEPEDLFPLQPLRMFRHYANDIDGAVEFLRQYKPFWGGTNIILYDWQGNSVAIEKCSYTLMDVHRPGPDGRSHVSGMTCRDPQSAQGQHQQAMRDAYVERFQLDTDGPDTRFWAACKRFEKKLADGLRELGESAKLDDVVQLFVTPWPEGLNKEGLKLHPDQGLVGYTLMTHVELGDKKTHMRWHRNPEDCSFPAVPDVYRF